MTRLPYILIFDSHQWAGVFETGESIAVIMFDSEIRKHYHDNRDRDWKFVKVAQNYFQPWEVPYSGELCAPGVRFTKKVFTAFLAEHEWA